MITSGLIFEKKVLLFPVLVVLLATATFLVGGTLHAWNWWVPFTAVALVGGWRRHRREQLLGSLGFLVCACAMWLFCGVSVAPGWVDEGWYQIPAVQMLSEGWNPFRERTPEAVAALFGIDVADCRMLHIVYAAKMVWIFDAVAGFFTNDPFNPLVPILFFIVPGACCRIFRSMRGSAWWWKATAVAMLFCMAPNTPYVTDAVVAIAAVGLLLSFEEALAGRGLDVFSLVVYSFWMMGSKTNGMVHGVLFWMLFVACVAIWRRGDFCRCFRSGAVAAILLLVANATPYITSALDYGHPLYPRYTIDEKRFPSVDITQDFLTGRNEDAESMSWGGLFVNAYVSPSLARIWYMWRLDKPNFLPHSNNYAHYPNDSDGTCPTRFGMRFAFWFSIVVMVVMRPRTFGPVAAMAVAGIAAVPSQTMGYCRYIAWWQAMPLFAFISLVCATTCRRRLCTGLAVVVALGLFSIRPWTLPRRLNFELSRFGERRSLVRIIESGEYARVRPLRAWMEAQLHFMRMRIPEMAKMEQLPQKWKRFQLLFSEANLLPGNFFVLENADLMRRENARIIAECGEKGLPRLLRSLCVALPKSLFDRMCGRPTCDVNVDKEADRDGHEHF